MSHTPFEHDTHRILIGVTIILLTLAAILLASGIAAGVPCLLAGILAGGGAIAKRS